MFAIENFSVCGLVPLSIAFFDLLCYFMALLWPFMVFFVFMAFYGLIVLSRGHRSNSFGLVSLKLCNNNYVYHLNTTNIYDKEKMEATFSQKSLIHELMIFTNSLLKRAQITQPNQTISLVNNDISYCAMKRLAMKL